MMKKLYTLLLSLALTGSAFSQIFLVKDIAPDDDSDARNLFAFNGRLYFEADDGTNGDELWVSDGTEAGTILLKIINADPDDSSPNSDPQNFIVLNDLLYFNANNGDKTGGDKELWVTDGTEEGTMLVADLNMTTNNSGDPNGSNPQEMFVFGDTLYFQANDGSTTELWMYDGTNAPSKATDINPNGFATVRSPFIDADNERVWLSANNGTDGVELFLFNRDTVFMVKDIRMDGNGYNAGANSRTVYNNRFYFEADANDGTGDELYVSDGTEEGTFMLANINAGDENGDPNYLTEFEGLLYFKAEVNSDDHEQLWVTDGTTEGTKMAAEPNVGGDGEVEELIVFGDALYFSATNGTDGKELWHFQQDTASMFLDINPEGDASPEQFTIIGDMMYFAADGDNDGNRELWMTDGTVEGTRAVSSLFATTATPADIDDLTVVDGKLFFVGTDANDTVGEELYIFDPASLVLNTREITSAPADFKVFPNPSADGEFTIQTPITEDIFYRVFTSTGQLIQQGPLLDSHLSIRKGAGAYYVLFRTGDMQFAKSVMIQR